MERDTYGSVAHVWKVPTFLDSGRRESSAQRRMLLNNVSWKTSESCLLKSRHTLKQLPPLIKMSLT